MALVRVWYRPDGSVLVTAPAPASRLDDEDEATWLDRVFARAVETVPDLAAMAEQGTLAYVDMDDSELPPKAAPCTDCDQEHSVRDTWSMRDGSVVVDETVTNAQAMLAHLEQEIAELEDADAPDPSVWMALLRDRKRVAATTVLPRAEAQEALAPVKESSARQAIMGGAS